MMSKNRKNRTAKRSLSFALAFGMLAAGSFQSLAVYNPQDNGADSEQPIYNESGAHTGLDENTENVDISGTYSEEYAQEYIHAGAYILSSQPTTDQVYESGCYYETSEFSYGDGIYVIIQDPDSTEKFYTLIKSTQDLSVGDSFIYREGDAGGRLLDDKYTSTHMAGTWETSDYSYVSYDTSGGKLAAQTALTDEDGTPSEHQDEGFTYIYLVSETPADYLQRTSNEAAGLEEKAQSEERAYMPVNNSKSNGDPFNNWANLTAEDDMQYNDRIAKIGAMEGNSNTRLYSYSGQNVIVAKFAVSISESEALLTYSDTLDYDEEADYTQTEGSITIKAGESQTIYFHTQYTSTWGRDGYANAEISYEIGDESIISYVGKAEEEGAESYVLTGLSAGTTTLTATVQDSEGKYTGGASITLQITVE